MEGQKLLWIVFSVVLFVVVVLASVLYFLRPGQAQPAVAVSTGAAELDTYEYVRGSTTDLPVTATPETTGSLDIVVGEEPAGTTGAVATTGAATTTPAATTVTPAPVKARASTATTTAAPVTTPRAATTTTTRPAATPKPVVTTPTRLFWIQTASFRNRGGAEAMAASLGEKGIAGRLQVSDVGGKPFYRVRVGPYTNRDEAEKFLSWIKGVKGLEQSYISVVTP